MTRSGWTQSRRATSDLIEIRNYTVATWGKEQARLYLVGIKSAIERAASADRLIEKAAATSCLAISASLSARTSSSTERLKTRSASNGFSTNEWTSSRIFEPWIACKLNAPSERFGVEHGEAVPGIVDTLQSMLADLDLPQVDPRTDWQARAYPGSVRAINRQKLRDEVARILD